MMKKALEKKILDGVTRYYREFHKKAEFIPGKTRIPYAGRVYDDKEMRNIVGTALDYWLTAGPVTSALESKFRKMFDARSFLLVNSGSSANLLMIAACSAPSVKGGLRAGDEVITPAVTFPTTVAPIIQYGLRPVFVDSKVGTYNIDEELLYKAAGPRTRALFIPHTLGNPCEMSVIKEFCDKKRIMLIEDSCDALGARYAGKLVGTFGVMSSLSFYPAHHMTLGEGGGVIVNDGRFYRAALSVRDWGRDCICQTGKSGFCKKRFSMKMGGLPYGYDHKYIYSHLGYNLKVTEMQSAIGMAQFAKLQGFAAARKRNFKRYLSALSEFSEYLIMPCSPEKAQPSWFGFPITVKKPVKRLRLIQWLEDGGIETRLMFGGNVTRQPAFKGVKYRVSGALKGADTIMNDTFFIGVYPGLTDEMAGYVISRFREFFKNKNNFT